MPSSPLFSGSVELARNWCNNSFYKTSLSARFVVFELIRSLESLRPADLSYIIWISGAGTFYFCQIMARRSDHAAFQLFFKKCWRNAFWSLVVISCKSVRNTHPPQPGIYYIWKRGHEHWILHIFSTFYHSIMPKSCDKKKKKGGVILLIRVNCYQTVSRRCFSFYPLLTSIQPIVRDAGQSGSAWGVGSSKYPDISFQDENCNILNATLRGKTPERWSISDLGGGGRREGGGGGYANAVASQRFNSCHENIKIETAASGSQTITPVHHSAASRCQGAVTHSW